MADTLNWKTIDYTEDLNYQYIGEPAYSLLARTPNRLYWRLIKTPRSQATRIIPFHVTWLRLIFWLPYVLFFAGGYLAYVSLPIGGETLDYVLSLPAGEYLAYVLSIPANGQWNLVAGVLMGIIYFSTAVPICLVLAFLMQWVIRRLTQHNFHQSLTGTRIDWDEPFYRASSENTRIAMLDRGRRHFGNCNARKLGLPISDLTLEMVHHIAKGYYCEWARRPKPTQTRSASTRSQNARGAAAHAGTQSDYDSSYDDSDNYGSSRSGYPQSFDEDTTVVNPANGMVMSGGYGGMDCFGNTYGSNFNDPY